MSNEIKSIENYATNQLIDDALMLRYMQSMNIASQLSENEKIQFIDIAKAYQLNPFKREIYCIAYGQGERRKLNILTGYEVYLKRAERTGKLAGWKITCTGEGAHMKAVIEIHRKDWTMPLMHEVLFKEYAQESQIWKAKPQTMLKKVAIAQGFRLAFPDELGGMPYEDSELPSNGDIKLVGEVEIKKTETKKSTPAVTGPHVKKDGECGQLNTCNPELMRMIQDNLDKCTTADELAEAAKEIVIFKKDLSDEGIAALRNMYQEMQDKFLGE